MGSALSPVQQLGIGVKNRAEIGGRMTQLLVFDSEDHIASSLWTMRMVSTLSPTASSALSSPPSCSIGSSMPTYGSPSPLFRQGELVAHMATGCKQGDTFGPLLYAVGFQSTLLLTVQDALAPGSKTKPVFAPPPGGGEGGIRFY